jgi:hypothetical protein
MRRMALQTCRAILYERDLTPSLVNYPAGWREAERLYLPPPRVRFILQGMKPTLTPHQFVDTWANVHHKESSAYVTHFDDLCMLVRHPKPVHMDKTGAPFSYQKGALREQAGEIVEHGFADVWYKDHFVGLAPYPCFAWHVP